MCGMRLTGNFSSTHIGPDTHRLRVLGPEPFCIALLNTQCEEVPMKWAQLRFHFGRKCLAIRHWLLTEFFRLLTEFFPLIESARQESNRAHGSLERAHAPLEGKIH